MDKKIEIKDILNKFEAGGNLMNRLLSAILVLIFSFYSCSVKEDQNMNTGAESTFIFGKLSNGSGRSVLLQKFNSEGYTTIDSIILDNNSEFKTVIHPGHPQFYLLRNENNNYISFPINKEDSITISVDYNDFDNFELRGSKEMEEVTNLHTATVGFLKEVAEYARIISDSVESPYYKKIRMETDRKYHAALNRLKNYSSAFIERNEGSLITLLAVTNQVGRELYVFDPVKDFDVYSRVDSILKEKYPESEAVDRLHSRIQMIKLKHAGEIKRLEKGDSAPDFEIAGTSGEIIHLSDLRGKVVLLNFWASWCKTCRQENKILIKIYEKHRKNAFEIFQISLDNDRENWINAINEDELTWMHGSDLNFWNSEVAERYGINSIPANFLIDQDGRIIAKDISSLELSEKLEGILTKSES